MQIWKTKKIGLLAKLGILLLSIFIIFAIFGPMILPRDFSEMDTAQRLMPPGETYILGSDEFGRDILVRTLYGLRTTLQISIMSAVLAFFAGTFLGLMSGYFGSIIDSILMRIMDILLSFPVMLIAILFVTVLGPGKINLTVAITIAFIPTIARMARGVTLSVKQASFVEVAKLYGAPNIKIMVNHIIPNILGPIIVITTLNVGTSVLMESALSFLGLGVRPPVPSLGLMISDGRSFIETAPWIIMVPGITLTLLIITFNLIGDGLRDIVDPINKN
jgi:peptide/nickel transport system permease protein